MISQNIKTSFSGHNLVVFKVLWFLALLVLSKGCKENSVYTVQNDIAEILLRLCQKINSASFISENK